MSKGYYDTEMKDDWRPCLRCGSELVQEREAFFVCINCKQEYIATKEDMRR